MRRRTSSCTSEPIAKALRSSFEKGSRILVLGGPPFPEEIAMWWNFVARDRTELARAYQDWTDRTDRFRSVTTSLQRIEAPRPFWLQ